MKTYSQDIKDKVRQLRSSGASLNEIYGALHIPHTTIRGWIKDIQLSKEQKQKFKDRTLKELQKGRIRFQKINKDQRLLKEKDLFQKGIEEIGSITKKELFIAGIALYWAEGFKNIHEHRLGFCNSDPKMMKLYIHWLEECLGVEKKDLVARVTLNNSYINKTNEIENYWSNFLDIPIEQFTKPFYQNSTWKKQFNTDSYKGVIRIHVKNSLSELLKMRGWIEALKMIK